jgi:glucosamine-phosphate N-acetyltransferase
LKSNDVKTEFWIDLGDNLILRPLRRDDYERGYLKLLSQLTVVGDLSRQQYEQRFDAMKASLNTYYTLVVADVVGNRIAASTTLVYEQKFIRNASSRGRIEDVVVDESYRGKKLSKILLDVACLLSKKLGNYKLSLECKDDLRPLYEQFGFKLEDHQNYLCQRF